MRVSLAFDVVPPDGGGSIAEPIAWPVFAAVDDAALRLLAGDVSAADWLFAPGPLGKGEAIAWQREIAERGVAGGGQIGFGLLYTDGGAESEGARAAYDELVAALHGLVVGHAAQATGLAVLLGAFGGRVELDGKADVIDLDRVREGVDPAELENQLDPDLTAGLDAFRLIGEELLPFTLGGLPPAAGAPAPPKVVKPGGGIAGPVIRPGVAPTTGPAAGGPVVSPATPGVPPQATPVKPVAPAVVSSLRPAVAVRPPVLSTPITRLRPPAVIRGRALAAGTVVAATVQSFRIADLVEKGEFEVHRELPARAELRKRLELVGRVIREER